jgi:multiple sugar transport system permease protein
MRRLLFGYTLLAPAVLYVGLLVGVPFIFSLYLAVSDATVGDPIAHFVGLENIRAALENQTFYVALRNSAIFTVGAGIMKGLLGTTLAFLLVQPFVGRRAVRALVVVPFTLPIAVSVLGWKWMFDSQFSVVNWALSRVGAIGSYGSPDWPCSQ